MKVNSPITWVFAFLLLLWIPSQSFSRDKDPKAALKRFKSADMVNATWQEDVGRIKTLRGKLSLPYSGKPEEAARKFLLDNPELFQLSQDLSDLSVESVREAGATEAKKTIIKYQQSYEGLPVFNGSLQIHLREDNSIERINNNYIPNLSLSTTPSFEQSKAVEIAKADFNAGCQNPMEKEEKSCNEQVKEAPSSLDLGIFEDKGKAHLAYRVVLDIQTPRALMEYIIDANSGTILKKLDRIQRIDGQGRVFNPNPTNTLLPRGIIPQDNNDANDTTFNQAYFAGPLRDITQEVIKKKSTYYLIGPYVDVRDDLEPPFYFSTTSGRISVTNPSNFVYTRDKDEFEHVMVYYHIDTNQRYIQSLGFMNLNSRRISVDPHGNNSHYVPNGSGTGYIALTEEGIDDAEDADMILHESCHSGLPIAGDLSWM